MGHIERMGHRPGRGIIKKAVGEGDFFLEKRANHQSRWLIGGDNKGRTLLKGAGADGLIVGEFVIHNVVPGHHGGHCLGAGGVSGITKNIRFYGVGFGFGSLDAVELLPVGNQVVSLDHGAFQGCQACRNVVADGEGKRKGDGGGLLQMSPRTRLFKQETDTPEEIYIVGTVARIQFVEPFFGKIKRLQLIEGAGKMTRKFGVQAIIQGVGYNRVVARTFAGIEIKCLVGTHLVVVCHHVGLPFVKELQPCLAFGVDGHEPVAVEVEPVMIHAATGPYFVVLTVERIGHKGGSLVHIGPVGVAFASVGV